jgi:hypothetical protein
MPRLGAVQTKGPGSARALVCSLAATAAPTLLDADAYWLFAVVLLPLRLFHEAFCAVIPLVVPHMIVSPFD